MKSRFGTPLPGIGEGGRWLLSEILRLLNVQYKRGIAIVMRARNLGYLEVE